MSSLPGKLKPPRPRKWQCRHCGKWHFFGVWRAVHGTEPLKHVCECFAEHSLRHFKVTMTKPGSPATLERKDETKILKFKLEIERAVSSMPGRVPR